jgi:hypothetical protein
VVETHFENNSKSIENNSKSIENNSCLIENNQLVVNNYSAESNYSTGFPDMYLNSSRYKEHSYLRRDL